jgi:hypothetical protein
MAIQASPYIRSYVKVDALYALKLHLFGSSLETLANFDIFQPSSLRTMRLTCP